ncbi:hypothetical protein PIB30_086553 [Stylosanthes scabra]|uniref:Uncharacterized protein n=1 Tax=Stylosanthes scabra TaxID=79078 RepID=A0ABU6QSP0_9FABA|nr:hypothetical protein [Stylosanthes scabra]
MPRHWGLVQGWVGVTPRHQHGCLGVEGSGSGWDRNHEETEEDEENREQRKLESSYKEPKLIQSNIKATKIPSSSLSKQGHVWTKFQTWPKHGSPNPSPRLAEFQRSGNKDKRILNFDPEIERTFRKLRKQSKQTHEISSEEVFEEVFDNMAAEGTQEKTFGRIFYSHYCQLRQ